MLLCSVSMGCDDGAIYHWFLCGSASHPPCTGSHLIQRAVGTRWPSVKHMRVDHRRFEIAMPQQLLDGSNVKATFEQVRSRKPTP